MKGPTLRAIEGRNLSVADVSLILDCTEADAALIMSGDLETTARQHMLLRLCANVPAVRLRHILDEEVVRAEWRPVPGYPAYQVSAAGVVRRTAGGHGSQPGTVLKPRNQAGYLRVNLSRDGVARSVQIHMAVCTAFHGPRPGPNFLVCHRNDERNDNRADNLYWGTPSQNAYDAIRNRLRKFGTNTARAAKPPKPLTRRQMRIQTQLQIDARMASRAGVE